MLLRTVVLMSLSAGLLLAAKDYVKRFDAAAAVMQEIMDAPDRSIPHDLLDKAYCIVIVPGLKKGAFIFGGKYGKGYLLCRRKNGAGWTSPGTVRIEGGSFGLQIGGSESDDVLLVMTQRGMDRLLSSKFTLGADASVAAGPVGRTTSAQTDAFMTAEILSWSRSRGVFAGVALQGATLRNDLDDNKELYGTRLNNREIIQQNPRPPAAARKLIALLDKYSSRQKK